MSDFTEIGDESEIFMDPQPSGVSSAAVSEPADRLAAGCRKAVAQLVDAHNGVSPSELGMGGALASWTSIEEFEQTFARFADAMASHRVFSDLSAKDANLCVDLVVPLISWTPDPAAFLRLLSSNVSVSKDDGIRSWDDRAMVGIVLNEIADCWANALSDRA